MAVTDESRSQFAIIVLSGTLNFKIKDAHSEARFPLINTAVARAHHDASSRLSFAAEINHGVRDRRIALDRISSGPEKQVARRQILQFEGIVLLTEARLDTSCTSQPKVMMDATALSWGWGMVTQMAPASAKSFASGAAKRLVKALVKLLFFCVKLMAILLLLPSRISLPWESANLLALQLGSESATSSLG